MTAPRDFATIVTLPPRSRRRFSLAKTLAWIALVAFGMGIGGHLLWLAGHHVLMVVDFVAGR